MVHGRQISEADGHRVSMNRRLASMWHMPDAIAESRAMDQIVGWMMGRLRAPDAFLRTVSELDFQWDSNSYDILELDDGRTIERFSKPTRDDNEPAGRVWIFRESGLKVRSTATTNRSIPARCPSIAQARVLKDAVVTHSLRSVT